MRLTIITITLALAGFSFAGTASADAPSFDSDCVGTQWVIRNQGLESFLVATPTGEAIGMIEVGTIYEPPKALGSVIISDTVIVRPSCEVFAAPSRLPATGTDNSWILALFAVALVAAGSAARRVARVKG